MARGEHWLPVGVDVGVGAEYVAVAAYYFLLLGVPHYELLVAVVAGVELVEVYRLARASAGLAEHYFAQAANLPDDVWRIVYVNDVYLVVALVCHAELPLGRQFALEQCLVDGLDDFLFHFMCVLL